jgi:hypothetical protein
MATGFVYCWTDRKNNMLYVGSHKGNIEDGYICSSKYMLEEYKKRPEDFSRKIIAEGEIEDIRKLETKILQSVNASVNEDFYNKHENDGFFFDGWKKGEMSSKHRFKISLAKKGKNLSESHKKAIADNNGRLGKTNSEDHKKALIESRIGSKHTENSKRKMSESRKKNTRCKEMASEAGKASADKYKNSPERQKAHSERMKKWWADRKAAAAAQGGHH